MVVCLAMLSMMLPSCDTHLFGIFTEAISLLMSHCLHTGTNCTASRIPNRLSKLERDILPRALFLQLNCMIQLCSGSRFG